jgi:acyl-phosphate glycerol 3-phosphate acyltransferase
MKKHAHLSPALAYIAAYLYGSFPLVYWLGLQSGVNLKQSGSGNVGISNLAAAGGTWRALMGGLFDVSKGFIPIHICRRLGYPEHMAELAGVCGVIGQCWPLFLRFNGGRGVSSFLGTSLLINRRGWGAAMCPIIAGAVWSFFSSLGGSGRKPDIPLKGTRGKAVPFGCFLGVLAFPFACALDQRRAGGQQPALAPFLLSGIILGRRLTAPLPDDAVHGPGHRKQALAYRLLYDRNTIR